MNPLQQLVYDDLLKFSEDRKHYSFYLFGYAGSGKTYIISHFVKHITDQFVFDNIIICSPTHVSLQVLESNMPNVNNNICRFFTVQRVLGYKPSVNTDDGTIYFSQKKKPKISPLSLLIIDECSMINKDMSEKLKLLKCKKIFLGDMKQLPPVGEKITNIFQQSFDIEKYKFILESIVRAKSSVLKEINIIFRNWNGKDDIIDLLAQKRDGLSFKMFHCSETKSSNWFINYIDSYDHNSASIILCWTREKCKFYNKMIREYILGDNYTNNFATNDIIVFNNFYEPEFSNENDQFVQAKEALYTSDVCKVIDLSIKNQKLIDWKVSKFKIPSEEIELKFNKFMDKLSDHVCDMDVIKMTVNKINSNNPKNIDMIIYTISRDFEESYKEYINLISAEISLFNKSHDFKKIHERAWDIYHKQLIVKYAEIDFGYSITVHKSQGRTYDSVYVDFQNIIKNNNIEERSKCMYTATSRASNELFLLI